MGEDLCYTTALELVGLYESKRVSPVEVARAILERIERLNPILNCYCYCNRDDVLAAARQSEARWSVGEPLGPLDGVPVSIKDLLLTKGWPTRCGSRLIDPQGPWTEDDPAVARLRESGAVLLGKMTTPEFGNSGITDSPLTGVTVNPWDRSRTTGGSSGGSVAAVASGLGPLSIGTDTGGSIRTPSSFCGLVGLKPTFGRVAQYPETDWGGISVSGPIARTASDAALLMTVIAQPDPATASLCPATTGTTWPKAPEGSKGGGSPSVPISASCPWTPRLPPSFATLPDASRPSVPVWRRLRRRSTIPFISSTPSGRRSSRPGSRPGSPTIGSPTWETRQARRLRR